MSTLRFDFLHLVSKWLKVPSFGSNSWGSRGSIPHCSRSTGVSWHWQPGQLNTSHHGTLFFYESDQWLLRSGELNLGFFQIWQQKPSQNYTQNLWSTSRHKDPTGNFPKIPRWGKSERPKVLVPYMKASGSQCYSSRMCGCMFKSCGALITVRTRYRSETDRNVTNKLCWYLYTVLLYWRLIRCRSELVQPSCFSTSSSFYRLPS